MRDRVGELRMLTYFSDQFANLRDCDVEARIVTTLTDISVSVVTIRDSECGHDSRFRVWSQFESLADLALRGRNGRNGLTRQKWQIWPYEAEMAEMALRGLYTNEACISK